MKPEQRRTQRLLAMSSIGLVVATTISEHALAILLRGWLRPVRCQVWLDTPRPDIPVRDPNLLRVLAALPSATTWNQVAGVCGLAPRTLRVKLTPLRRAYHIPAWLHPADFSTALLESLAR